MKIQGMREWENLKKITHTIIDIPGKTCGALWIRFHIGIWNVVLVCGKGIM